MGQTASEIESHIEEKREDLSQNLRELENKVRAAADWRHQFENHPGIFLSAAFCGGVLLAAAFGGSSGSRSRDHDSSPGSVTENASSRSAPAETPVADAASRTWENLKGALIGVAASRLKDYVDEIVPGFAAQYREAEVRQKY